MMNGRERAHTPAKVDVTLKDLLAILGGGKRLELFMQLAREPSDVQTLSRACDLDEADVSKNLRVLRDLELVEFRQIKKSRHYRLAGHISVRERGCRLRLGLDVEGGTRIAMLVRCEHRPPPQCAPLSYQHSDYEQGSPCGMEAKVRASD